MIFAIAGFKSFFGREIVEGVIINIYIAFMLANVAGQTIGNKALGTRTANAQTGAAPDLSKTAVRSLVSFVLQFTLIGGILDILWPLWDAQNQTLHDKAAGTVVLRTR